MLMEVATRSRRFITSLGEFSTGPWSSTALVSTTLSGRSGRRPTIVTPLPNTLSTSSFQRDKGNVRDGLEITLSKISGRQVLKDVVHTLSAASSEKSTSIVRLILPE